MEHEVAEDIPVGKRRGVKKSFEYDLATEGPEELTNEEALHTESCPEGCCEVRIVARYLLKSA
ncbi:MAG: hypothetical protein ACLPXM_17120 [Terriglobales bacterium]